MQERGRSSIERRGMGEGSGVTQVRGQASQGFCLLDWVKGKSMESSEGWEDTHFCNI